MNVLAISTYQNSYIVNALTINAHILTQCCIAIITALQSITQQYQYVRIKPYSKKSIYILIIGSFVKNKLILGLTI